MPRVDELYLHEKVSAGAVSRWPDSLRNGSEMGDRIRFFDWSNTPLGPIEAWPQSLCSYVNMIVESKFPMYIFWGPHYTAIYNDCYASVAGDKHPSILGRATEDAWPEAWPTIEPLLHNVLKGEAVTIEDCKLILMRYGFPEEFYHTLCYSPLRNDDNEIHGILSTFTETTARVLAHRRMHTLLRLASRAATAADEADALRELAEALEESSDIQFALIYLADTSGSVGRLRVNVGAFPGDQPPAEIDMVTDFEEREINGEHVVLTPIPASDRQHNIGAFVAGTSAWLRVDEAYREFLTLIAAQIGDAVARARRLCDERTRSESVLAIRTIDKITRLAESGQQLFWMAAAEGEVDWLNQAWYDYTGQTADEAQGWGWTSVLHSDDRVDVMRIWPRSLEQKVPFEMTFRLRGKDSQYRWFLTRAVPETDDFGHIVRWYGTCTNIDFERQAARQLDVFSRLGEKAGQALDAHSALKALSEALVPDFADWTLINLADADGTLVLSEARHYNPEMMRLLEPFVGKNYEQPNEKTGAKEVFLTGKSRIFQRVAMDDARGKVQPAFEQVLEKIDFHSIVIVPIVASGKILGTFHAVCSETMRSYSPIDVPFFEEIGRRSGYALQNAQAFERESKIARSFQDAALPADLPDIPGIHFSSLYEPASSEARVGGDFFDAFRLLDGRLVVSIGDVAGSGLAAAATMAALRQSIRAAASINPDPDLLLKAAEGVLMHSRGVPLASAFVAVIDPLTFSMQYANAGHPPPLLRATDGSVSVLRDADLLLGVDLAESDAARGVTRLALEPGEMIVLYTDGLTEATHDPEEGERRLMRAAEALAIDAGSVRSAVQQLHGSVLERRDVAHDDIAMLTVFFEHQLLESPSDLLMRRRFACDDGEAAHRVRNEIVTCLAAHGLLPDSLFAAEMIFSELVGNVLRYSGTHVDVALDLTQSSPVLHVLDSGPGFFLNPKLPAEPYSERGRGLYIVTQLARDFTTSPRTLEAGMHARAVLRGAIRKT